VQKGSDSSVRGFVHVRSELFGQSHSQDQDNDGDERPDVKSRRAG
jgi:hypothetical protein